MELQLANIAIYNTRDQLVSNAMTSARVSQVKCSSSFDTAIELTGDQAGLVVGETYYVVGVQSSGQPFRSESAQLKSVTGSTLELDGSVAFPTGGPQDSGGADMLITYSNYSPTNFSLSTNWANLQDGFGSLTVSPGPVLQALSGQQSMGASQLLSVLDEGPADIGLCWAAGYNFGVWIHFNFQMFGIGPRPVWYVSTNGSPWILAGSDPSIPYTFDSTEVGGLKIVATPTSGHSSLTVSTVISSS